MHICDTIRATGLERYLVIGSTRDSTTAIIEQTGPRWGGALYYLDDVSVRKIAGGTVGRRRIREVCADELPVQLAARAGFEHYRWSTSTGDTMATLSVSAAGSYWVAQDYGCGYVIDTIELRVAPPYQPPSGWADLSLRRDTLICASGLPLRLQGRAGFARYRWSTGDPTQATEAFSAGRYLLHLDEGYAAGCGQLVDTFAVAVEAQGPPIELGPDRINCQADRLQAVTLDAGPDQPQYRWSTGEITQAITVQDPGQYWVAAAHAVCLDRSDSLHLLGCEPLRVIIDLPTVFTPNADGLNDRWLGQYANVQFTRLLVWDRWGRMVFDTTDPQQAWDGTARGKRQPPGVYFYHWTGQADDAPSQRRGTVTLLR
jgi:gliding motility-associated-like protein